MLNLDKIVGNKQKQDNWPFRILIIGPSGSGKTNLLLNIIQKLNDTDPIDKIYLYAKDLSEPKYKYLINKREQAGNKYFNDPTAFIEYSNDMNDVFTNIDDYNKQRKRKVLIIFDDMIADIINNKNFKAIDKEFFIRCRKLNVSIVFITQSYFRTPKDARLNSTHHIIMKIQNKKELQSIAQEDCGDIDLKDILSMYQKFTNDLYSSMIIDTTLPSRHSMRFRKNF